MGTNLFHEDGQVYSFNIVSGEIDCYELKDLRINTKDGTRIRDVTAYLSLRSKEGTIWYFDNIGRLIRKQNRFGDVIDFLYVGYSRKIDYIIDTLGRKIDFTYLSTQIKVDVYADTSATTSLETWIYGLSTNGHGYQKLDSVTNPLNQTTRYHYSPVTGYFSSEGPGEAAYEWNALTAVVHPIQSSYRYEWETDNLLYEEEPSYPGYFHMPRVVERYSEVPIKRLVPGDVPYFEAAVSIEDWTIFTYQEQDPDGNYGTTAIKYKDVNKTEFFIEHQWVFNETNLITKKTQIPDTGVDGQQTETITYKPQWVRRKLPTIEETTVTVGGVSRTEQTNKVWDEKGNLLYQRDQAGRTTQYEYDPTYSILIRQYDWIDQGDTQGRVTENVLDGTKRVVLETSVYDATKEDTDPPPISQGPTTTNISTGSWDWWPEGIIHEVTLSIPWHYNMFFAKVAYKVEYREVGDDDWTQWCTAEHGGTLFAGGGTDTVTLTLSAGTYNIRVLQTKYGGEVGVSAATAYGTLHTYIAYSPKVTQAFNYNPDHPGNVINVKTYDSDEVTVLSETHITYDDVWDAFPATTTVGNKTQVSTYDSLGRVVTYRSVDNSYTTDLQKASATTEVTYDKLGRPLTTILPLQSVAQSETQLGDRPQRTWTYDDSNRKVIYTNENMVVTEVEYDGLGRVVVEKQPGNSNALALYTEYDRLGRVASVTDALNHTTSYQYDGLGRRTKTTFTDNSSQKIWYVDVGSLGTLPVWLPALDLTPPSGYSSLPWVRWELYEDEDGQPTYRGFDVVGRLVWEASNPEYVLETWEVTWREYDRFDNLTAIYTRRDSSGWDKTAYEYSLFKTPTVLDMPGSTESIHTYTYDGRGLKTSEDSDTTSPMAWQYDEHGRPTKVVYGSTTEVRFTYEKEDQLDKVVAKVVVGGLEQSAVTQVFNLRGWLASESWAFDNKTYTLGYEYDDVGNVTKINYPEGYTSIGYNSKNLPTQVGREPNLPLGQFTYEANGLLQSTLYNNGVSTQYTYTDRNRLQTLASAPLTLSLGYEYYLNGNVSSINDNGVWLGYAYDGANRLITSMTKTANGVVNSYYSYDLAGNRLSETWNGVTSSYTYLPGNYLQSINGSIYSWGDYGQLTAKQSSGWTYEYDDRRLLQAVKQNGTSVANYIYDAYGRRIRAVEDGTTVDTIYIGNDIVYEVRNPDGTAEKTRYITANGRYLAKITPTGTYYYHIDGVGSIRALTDATGQVVARFDYEPFGDVSQTSGSYASQEVHRFTGKPQDPGTGLYYFNARYMDPEIGRFISVDPARDGMNWYAYAAGNPLRYVDPDGEHTRWVSYIPLFGWGYTLGEGLYHLFGGKDNQDHDWCEWQSTMFISTAITVGSVGAVAAGLSNAGVIAQGASNLAPTMVSGTGTHLRRVFEQAGYTIQINSGHAFNRVHATGSVQGIGTMDQIETAIIKDLVPALKGGIELSSRAIERIVELNGSQIGYSVMKLVNDVVSISTYYPK